MKRGLVIGKFYPPHAGHKFLIESGLAQCDRLVVIVCHRDDQKIPGTLRAKWIQEIHPQAEVRVVQDILRDDDSKAWADTTRSTLGYAPDVVFSSEDYGPAFAGFLGARHVLIDKDRVKVPVSGTQVRRNAFAVWDFLEPCVRAYFAKRVCVVGAESTGTTTLARALAGHYHTAWVPEYGRFYSEGKLASKYYSPWRTGEFIHIAGEQNRLEDSLAGFCDKLLVCDTDSFATRLWHERYVGHMSPEVGALCEGRRYELYFLTAPDIPFVQDGTRDGEHLRHQMHRRFVEELTKAGKPYLLLEGSHESRFKKAVEACDKVLGQAAEI